jgi:hypothetical protein
MTRMKFSSTTTVMLMASAMAISVTGLAQQTSTLKVKHSTPEKVKQSPPLSLGKTPGMGTTASAANAKDLQALEHQAAAPKPGPSSQTAAKASPQSPGKKSAAPLTPIKDKSNPPINFAASTAPKNSGLVTQGSNPYKGRLREHQ